MLEYRWKFSIIMQ